MDTVCGVGETTKVLAGANDLEGAEVKELTRAGDPIVVTLKLFGTVKLGFVMTRPVAGEESEMGCDKPDDVRKLEVGRALVQAVVTKEPE